MERILKIILFTFFVSYTSCDKEAEVASKNYPYLITENVSDITKTSVVFNGKLISISDEEIKEIGFLWDLVVPTIESSNKITVEPTINTGPFSIKINYKLYKAREQFVRAFLRTNELTVYGNIIKFFCNGGKPPVIENISPLQGYASSTVIITGENFGDNVEHTHVLFDGVEAEINSIMKDTIITRVPDIDHDMDAEITIDSYNKTVRFDKTFSAFTYWRIIPKIPGAGRYGAASFTLNGKGYVCSGTNYVADEFLELWEYDPVSELWSGKSDFPGNPRTFAVGFAMNGKGYIGFGAGQEYYFDLWEYAQETDSWSMKNVNDQVNTFLHPYFVINDLLYFITKTETYNYSPDNNQFTIMEGFPGDYRYYSVGLTCNELGFITSGRSYNSGTLRDLWCFDPSANKWFSKASLSGGSRAGHTAFAINGKVYEGLGFNEWWGILNDFYEYDPLTNKWTRIQDFPGGRRKFAVSFVIGNKAYVGTGIYDNYEEFSDFWEFDPLKIKD